MPRRDRVRVRNATNLFARLKVNICPEVLCKQKFCLKKYSQKTQKRNNNVFFLLIFEAQQTWGVLEVKVRDIDEV